MAAIDLSLSGLSSGFDWKTMVDKITQVNQMPQAAVRKEQSGLTTQNNILSQLNTRLTDLKAKVDALQSSALYTARKSTSSDTSVAAVTTDNGAVLGDFSLIERSKVDAGNGCIVVLERQSAVECSRQRCPGVDQRAGKAGIDARTHHTGNQRPGTQWSGTHHTGNQRP